MHSRKIYLHFGCIYISPIGDMICCRHFFAPVLVPGTSAGRRAASIRLVHSPSLLLRIDCIGNCHSGLWDAIISSSKTSVLVILALQRDTQFMISPHCTALHCTALRPQHPPPPYPSQFQDARLHMMSCMQYSTRYRTDFTSPCAKCYVEIFHCTGY